VFEMIANTRVGLDDATNKRPIVLDGSPTAPLQSRAESLDDCPLSAPDCDGERGDAGETGCIQTLGDCEQTRGEF
jgi:hypothetical protein